VKSRHSKKWSIRAKLALRPLYPSNLAPSDFLAYIKQKIAGQEFVSLDDLLDAIREEFDRLSKSVLESVFDKWLIHLQTCVDYPGSYFREG
jgi:hypothetical protein